jgi:hypothetical protein
MRSADRWRPVRAGIVNLYEYGDQVFELAGGRLLLRGHNTSGKTKALELLLPFCLDGDISPRKLDPFARSAKEMHWNLIECGDHDQRTGYVWLEFERLAAEAGPARLAMGIGMKANRSSRDVRRWYFVARDRKVRADLRLVREDREPLSRAELAAAIGDDGEVLDTQAEYRRRLNDLLFGFPSEDGYRTMLRLMLELRRPHLSKNLNPDAVAELLSAGLPSVDEALMRRLAGGLEQLDALDQALARLRATSERLRQFHERAYRSYLRAVVRDRGERLRRSHTRFDTAAEAVRSLRVELDEAELETGCRRDERFAAEHAIVRLEGEMQAIVGSAQWGSIAEVQALGERAASQARTAEARRESAEEAAGAAAGLEAECVASTAAAADDTAAAQAGLDELGSLAERAGLAARAGALAAQLREEAIAVDTWAGLARDLARDWMAVLATHGEQLDRCRSAAQLAAAAREAERRAAERLSAACATVAEADAQLGAAREAFDAALAAWSGALHELQADADMVGAMRDRAHTGKDPRTVPVDAADAVRAAIAAERGTVAAALRAVDDEVAECGERIDAVAGERDDGPPSPRLPRTSPTGGPGPRCGGSSTSRPRSRRRSARGSRRRSRLQDCSTPGSFRTAHCSTLTYWTRRSSPGRRRRARRWLTLSSPSMGPSRRTSSNPCSPASRCATSRSRISLRSWAATAPTDLGRCAGERPSPPPNTWALPRVPRAGSGCWRGSADLGQHFGGASRAPAALGRGLRVRGCEGEPFGVDAVEGRDGASRLRRLDVLQLSPQTAARAAGQPVRRRDHGAGKRRMSNASRHRCHSTSTLSLRVERSTPLRWLSSRAPRARPVPARSGSARRRGAPHGGARPSRARPASRTRAGSQRRGG